MVQAEGRTTRGGGTREQHAAKPATRRTRGSEVSEKEMSRRARAGRRGCLEPHCSPASQLSGSRPSILNRVDSLSEVICGRISSTASNLA